MEKKVCVRFAPSPTGPLHIGGVRTALFNYVYALANGGTFILRFEDTDKDRSEAVFENNIKDGLKWMGIEWDEEYHQSKRADIYKKYLDKLKAKDLIYEHDGGTYFRLPEKNKKIIVDDLIRGKVEFNSQDFDDVVLFKKDGSPTFHFANVVDDIDMNITHVIRGEDHLSNTPKHILLYEALGADVPKFAHIPLILNPDKSKMSKRMVSSGSSRAGDIDFEAYIKAGYLPEAMINFLAQLGWSPPDENDFFTLEELVKMFTLDRVQKAGAVFDIKNLNHINHHYLMEKSLDDYIKLAEPYITHLKGDKDLIEKALKLVQDRAQTLSEIPDLIEYFLKAPKYDGKLLIFKKSSPEQTAKGLDAALKVLEAIDERDWVETKLQQVLDNTVAAEGLLPGDVFWPVRVALSGEEGSPSPTELLAALGKDESIKRIKTAIGKLASSI
ncbi:glutamate--tRNA ligase [candidate division Kazan bacterium]|uniref:Glutamate--tRNA ligase n=1 Tax=candidate division Kazan bacterium TaxID=2202143 RepID=A0A420ZDT0_UNCK3|nr:MAG: glutamate--tRNA ligase [candidate division Kazan bacterium]